MKKYPRQPALIGLLTASVLLALPLAARAQAAAAEPSAPAKAEAKVSKNLSGKVTAKSDTSLTVDGRTISLTSATTYSRGGTSIGSGDIKAGDTVNIVTTDDGQVAVSVAVTTSP